MTPLPTALELDEIRPPRAAAHDWHIPLSLRVPMGAFVTVVTSPTRAGALFRIALGFDAPVAGTVRVLGAEPHRLGRAALRTLRRRIGSCLVPDGLMANITVRANVALPLVFGDGCSSADAHARADEVLTRFSLDAWADRRPSDLSPDTRQVAALARAVVARPELLLLHDPLTSMPSYEALRLLRICREYAATILAAVHGEEEAVCVMADRAMAWDTQGVRELVRA